MILFGQKLNRVDCFLYLANYFDRQVAFDTVCTRYGRETKNILFILLANLIQGSQT